MTTHGIAPTNGSFAAHAQKRWRLFPILALTLAFASGGPAGAALAFETSATGRCQPIRIRCLRYRFRVSNWRRWASGPMAAIAGR